MRATSFLILRPTAAAVLVCLHALSASAQTPAGGGETALATVTVQASADASAEGLAKPYAGGQVARGGRVGILGNQDVMATPFSSTSYTHELILDQQAQSVADVLLNDPSVRQARGYGNFQELYVVRGFPLYSDDIAYNGLYGMLPRQYVASEFFERVEVFRGASAFLNGAAPGGTGLGGAINLLPKRAPSAPLSSVSAGVETGGQAFGAVDLARRFGPDESVGVRLNAVRRDGKTGIAREQRELSALGLGLDWHSSTVRLSADLGYQDHQLNEGRPSVTPAAGLPIAAAPDARRNFAQPWTYSEERDTFGTVRAEWDVSDQLTAWAAGGVRRSREANSLSTLSLTNAAGDSTGTRFDNKRRDHVVTGELGLRAKFATGAVGHTVTVSAAAFDAEERGAYAMGFGVQTNLYQPVASAAPAITLRGGDLDHLLRVGEVKTRSLAVADTLSFAQDTVLLTLGTRHQKIEQVSYDYTTGVQSDRYAQSRTTPVAGLLFKASPQISLYASYIEGLSKGDVAPTTANSLPVVNAGQVFAPYRSKQKEVGLKYDGGRVGASVALFTTSQPSSYVANQVFGQYGEQRNRGVELSVFGEPVKGLRLLGGLTALDAQQKKTPGGVSNGKDAIGVPNRQLNLGAEWDVPGMHGLALNARVINTSRQYADAANTQAVPAWTRTDLGVRYLMDLGNDRVLTLRARVDNLFNKSYWSSVGGYPGSNYLVLGAPRTFALSATVDF